MIRTLATSLTLCFLLGWAAEAFAQVNTESMRRLDTDGFSMRLSGNMALQQGNSNVFEVDGGGRIDYRVRQQYVFLNTSSRFARSDGGTFRNRSFAHLRYNYDFTERVTGEAFTQIERDAFTLLRARWLVGTGPRFRWAQTERWHLFQGTTLMHEYEALDESEISGRPPDENRIRWSNYVNAQLQLTENSELNVTVYVQPWLSDFSDIRILNEALLSFALTRHVSFQTGFDLRYDSNPAAEVQPLDIALRQGLVLTL